MRDIRDRRLLWVYCGDCGADPATAEQGHPDAVLMDIRLKGARDGVDAALELWERFKIRSAAGSIERQETEFFADQHEGLVSESAMAAARLPAGPTGAHPSSAGKSCSIRP
jgi:hypothetical protein